MILFYKLNLEVNKTNMRTQVQNGGRSVELENPLIMPTSAGEKSEKSTPESPDLSLDGDEEFVPQIRCFPVRPDPTTRPRLRRKEKCRARIKQLIQIKFKFAFY